MNRREWMKVGLIVGAFLLIYFVPLDRLGAPGALGSGLALLHDYARAHVLLCLVPAFFIAGAIGSLIDKGAILRFLGPGSRRAPAYGVGSLAGSVLAVCSCTILPLFAGIVRMGAGLGPASTFLYAGPAINVLAVIFTARVLGAEIALVRAVAAVAMSVLIGLTMAAFFRRDEKRREAIPAPASAAVARSSAAVIGLVALLIAVLVFANWAPAAEKGGALDLIHAAKWYVVAALAIPFGLLCRHRLGLSGGGLSLLVLALAAAAFLGPNAVFGLALVGVSLLLLRAGGEARTWFVESWTFARQITPLLLAGVLTAGILLGGAGAEGLIPGRIVAAAVGGNGLLANLGASLAGALMYFATLTEIPILEGLIGAGMGKGPALSLLLAGPALSLPNMLVIASVIGARKTCTYVAIVVAASTLVGLAYGAIA